MNVQDLVKRHFWVVGAVTVAACAFFGGRAVAHALDGALLTDPRKAPEVARAARADRPAAQARSKTGRALADRNIFCSTCRPPEPVAAAAPEPVGDGVPLTSLPLQLVATFVAKDFAHATILNTETHAQGGFVLAGNIFGAGEIVAIRYKHVDFRNASSGRVERISLLDEPRPVAAPPPAVAATVDTGPKDEMTAALDAGIRKVDETTFEVDRSLVNKLLADPLAASKGARVTPSIKNGKPNGIKLYAIRPSSVYAKLGLANGDTIHAINGFELDTLDKGLEVYQKVQNASSLQVSVTRRGKPVTINYSIK